MNSFYHPRGCTLYYRFITAILGILIGVSAGAAFAVVFHNYHCVGWALVSAIFATCVLVLHIRVYRDLSFSISPVTFQRWKCAGMVGMLVGIGVFIGYMIQGILANEKGIVIEGWYIVMVWGYMTWKWGFMLFWYARKYRNALMHEISDALTVNREG